MLGKHMQQFILSPVFDFCVFCCSFSLLSEPAGCVTVTLGAMTWFTSAATHKKATSHLGGLFPDTLLSSIILASLKLLHDNEKHGGIFINTRAADFRLHSPCTSWRNKGFRALTVFNTSMFACSPSQNKYICKRKFKRLQPRCWKLLWGRYENQIQTKVHCSVKL